jgi:phosphoribosylformylglycinamidine (FGAM) synthase-like enzyme
LLEQTGGPVPPIDYERAIAEIAFMRAAADAGMIRSARSIGSGGVLATIVEMSVDFGAALSPARTWSNGLVGELEAYFGECGGFVIEVDAAGAQALTEIASEHVELIHIGETVDQRVLTAGDVRFDLHELRQRWSRPLAEIYP